MSVKKIKPYSLSRNSSEVWRPDFRVALCPCLIITFLDLRKHIQDLWD